MVVVERLAQPALPAHALVAEAAHRLGALGPADRVGNERHPVRPARAAQMAMQPHHQVDILSHRVVPEPADLDHHVLPEYAERAGHDESVSSSLQAMRPNRNARRYSSTWLPASSPPGARTRVMPDGPNSHPLAIRMVPPAATVSAERASTACIIAPIAPGSSMLSPSTTHTYGAEARLMPALAASAFRPFTLSSTQSPGWAGLQ